MTYQPNGFSSSSFALLSSTPLSQCIHYGGFFYHLVVCECKYRFFVFIRAKIMWMWSLVSFWCFVPWNGILCYFWPWFTWKVRKRMQVLMILYVYECENFVVSYTTVVHALMAAMESSARVTCTTCKQKCVMSSNQNVTSGALDCILSPSLFCVSGNYGNNFHH